MMLFSRRDRRTPANSTAMNH